MYIYILKLYHVCVYIYMFSAWFNNLTKHTPKIESSQNGKEGVYVMIYPLKLYIIEPHSLHHNTNN